MTHRRAIHTNLFLLVIATLFIAMPRHDIAADHHESKVIKHSFFVAGPSFTGIIDEDGKEQWKAPRNGARDGWVLPNGHVLIIWNNEAREFNKEREVIWTYELDPSNKELGTIERLDNGNTLITELGPKPRLMEITRDGEIAVEVPLQPETDNNHMQTRMARKLPNGNYIVPHLFAYAVKEYKPDGTVVKAFETDTEYFGGRDTRHWPFTAIRLNNGHTVSGLTYGNRVVEFDKDGKVVWDLQNSDVGGIIHDACGVQRLPNGHTVVTSYGAKEGVKLFEVTPEKKVVWTYEGPHKAHHFQILTTNGKPIEGKPMK